MAYDAAGEWKKLYLAMKAENERNKEACRELSLELDKMREIYGTTELDRLRQKGDE